MAEKSYGGAHRTVAEDEVSRHAEEVALQGYTVMHGLFPPESLPGWREKVDLAYAKQEEGFGREALASIGELDVCRAPLLTDLDFLVLANHPRVLAVVRRLLGDWVILNLQNAIINRPGAEHHQGAWHRDLPYQNFVISRPLAVNALVAIDAFSAGTGGTHFVAHSHRAESLPSDGYLERNHVAAEVPAGAAIVFDSMLFHRAGSNRSQADRRAVNHMYTVPILKQQYDFPRALGERAGLDAETAKLLGYTCQVPLDDRAWRDARVARQRQAGA